MTGAHGRRVAYPLAKAAACFLLGATCGTGSPLSDLVTAVCAVAAVAYAGIWREQR